MAAWTVVWTLFQWWAVIGWPGSLARSPAALIVGGVATLVGLAVWHDVRAPRRSHPVAATPLRPARPALPHEPETADARPRAA